MKKKYRYLKKGEVLRIEDEHYGMGHWLNTCCAGNKVTQRDIDLPMRYRRPVKPKEKMGSD